ncbi:glycosyltransferase family 39 protein [Candidatus Woesebacteria bacterium]|nr:glycosyltransferase family 39 protein [Candidatus Woesebacteria bacterium]
MVVVLVGSVFFLRFYRLPEYLMFLSDQGRDAIVLKRLVTLEKLVFVGPTTSIGNVFTGPFYYYLVAPFMLLSGLHPVGPAFGIALINSVGLFGAFWFVVKRFGRTTALIFLALVGLSANQIWQSRFSWNPNPVALFTFLTLVAWQLAVERKRLRYYILAGVLFGLSFQLHYITIVILAPIIFSVISDVVIYVKVNVPKTPKFILSSSRHLLTKMLLFGGAAVATFAPLIVFEIKNNFINTQTLLRASSAGEIQAKNSVYLDRLRDTCAGLLQHLFLIEVNRDIAFVVIIFASLLVFYLAKKEHRVRSRFIVWSTILVLANILALSQLETGRHVHYYNPSYWLVYLIIAYIITSLYREIKKYMGRINNKTATRLTLLLFSLVILTLLSSYVQTQVKSLYFLTEKPKADTQITHAEHVAQYIIGQTRSNQYQVVGLPFYETEGHYRFFLEYYGHRPMPADALGDPQELFVICHELNKPDCDIPGNPQWQLADFENRHHDWRIESVKLVEEVRVFKLVY